MEKHQILYTTGRDYVDMLGNVRSIADYLPDDADIGIHDGPEGMSNQVDSRIAGGLGATATIEQAGSEGVELEVPVEEHQVTNAHLMQVIESLVPMGKGNGPISGTAMGQYIDSVCAELNEWSDPTILSTIETEVRNRLRGGKTKR